MACGPALFDGANPRCFSPPFHVRRASPSSLFTELFRITLDHPASHRLNSGSDWPSSRSGEGSMRPVWDRSDRFCVSALDSKQCARNVLDRACVYPRFPLSLAERGLGGEGR